MNLGERIQALLDEKQITQRELAEKIHVAPNTMNGYIKNRRHPDYATIVRIAQNLDTSSDYLLGNTSCRELPQLEVSSEEDILLNNYRGLDDHNKQVLVDISYCLYANGHLS
ncbi:MAG: helix-turn-helix transcriptional regulator [Clostridiales bacterium]|nr:helix-turn-helix transcriptional regulator [Clostridiales bacterium]